MNKFYDGIIQKVNVIRTKDLDLLEKKTSGMMNSHVKNMSILEGLVKEIDICRKQLDAVTEDNLSEYTENVHRLKELARKLEEKKVSANMQCGRSYDIKFPRAAEEYNKDVYKCIESVCDSFFFAETYEDKYLGSEDYPKLDAQEDAPFEFNGKTEYSIYGIEPRNLYSPKTNKFLNSEERESREDGSSYKLYKKMTEEHTKKSQQVRKDANDNYDKLGKNIEADTHKRAELFANLEKSIQVATDVCAQEVVKVYTSRDEVIKKMHEEFEAKNKSNEDNLKDEKKLFVEVANRKQKCESTYAGQEYERAHPDSSYKPAQEYIYTIGELGRKIEGDKQSISAIEAKRNKSFKMEPPKVDERVGAIQFVKFIDVDEKKEEEAKKKAEADAAAKKKAEAEAAAKKKAEEEAKKKAEADAAAKKKAEADAAAKKKAEEEAKKKAEADAAAKKKAEADAAAKKKAEEEAKKKAEADAAAKKKAEEEAKKKAEADAAAKKKAEEEAKKKAEADAAAKKKAEADAAAKKKAEADAAAKKKAEEEAKKKAAPAPAPAAAPKK